MTALQLRAEAYNLTNSLTWASPGTTVNNVSTFGVITGVVERWQPKHSDDADGREAHLLSCEIKSRHIQSVMSCGGS